MKKIVLFIAVLLSALSVNAYTWENIHPEGDLSLNGGAELVSSYNWRGFTYGGLSVQPWVELEIIGFRFGVWGNIGSGVYSEFNTFVPELDLSFSYTSPDNHFTLSLTHYHYFDDKFFNYDYGIENHGTSQSELGVNILFSEEYPFEFGANMMFGGGDCYSGNGVLIKENDKKAKKLFSTYLYVKYTLELDKVTIIPEIGISPNESMYTYYNEETDIHQNFAFNNLSCLVNYTFYDKKLVSMYLIGGFYFNFYDLIYEKFEYGKNFNCHLGLGIEL